MKLKKINKIKEFIYNNSRGYSFLPFFLGLSISNDCNRKCNFCLYQSPDLKESPLLSWIDKQPKEMSYDKFVKFIDNLGFMKHFISSVGLTAKGEPMKHPDFYRFCSKLNDAKIKFSVTTNGDYLDESELFVLRLFKYLTIIRVSVYEKKTYDRLKDAYGVEFYNMTGKEIKGTEEGVKLWADGLSTNNIPCNFNNIKSCKKPFSYLTLNPDGAITHCNSWHELGNAFTQPLYKMWNSKRSRDFRIRALTMDNIPDADCDNCGFNL